MKKILALAALLALTGSAFAQKKAANKPATKKAAAPAEKKELNVEYTTASGLKYKLIEKGTGKRAVPGSTVAVHYTGRLTDGNKFDSSRDRGQPFSFKLGQGSVIKGWDEGVALLNVGDKAIFTIPPALGYGERAMDKIPANSTLVFDVELMDVKEPIKPWEMNNKDTITTASGLKYLIVAKATDANAAQAGSGKTVDVHYTGFLTNGRPFDSSVERGQPISFQLGNGMVIKGWEEGIALMKKGEKIRLIIPSDLAYGPNGAGGVIPPNATLIFDVELMDVK